MEDTGLGASARGLPCASSAENTETHDRTESLHEKSKPRRRPSARIRHCGRRLARLPSGRMPIPGTDGSHQRGAKLPLQWRTRDLVWKTPLPVPARQSHRRGTIFLTRTGRRDTICSANLWVEAPAGKSYGTNRPPECRTGQNPRGITVTLRARRLQTPSACRFLGSPRVAFDSGRAALEHESRRPLKAGSGTSPSLEPPARNASVESDACCPRKTRQGSLACRSREGSWPEPVPRHLARWRDPKQSASSSRCWLRRQTGPAPLALRHWHQLVHVSHAVARDGMSTPSRA